jgi:hypothetical protein
VHLTNLLIALTGAGIEDNILVAPERRNFGKTSLFVYHYVDKTLGTILGRDNGTAALEFVAALLPPLARIYCSRREPMVRSEFDFFLSREALRPGQFDQVVMVGGGTIPITAMYWASRCSLPVIVLEKGSITTRLCRMQLRRLGLKHVSVHCISGEDYGRYANSIVLISLHATGKLQIVKKVLESGEGRKAVCVRTTGPEELGDTGVGWVTVAQYRDFGVRALVVES